MIQSLPHFGPFTQSQTRRKTMHEAALRVLVVALGLFLCPRDDPRLRMDWDNEATEGLQSHQNRLAREEEELEQQKAPVGETTETAGRPQDDATDVYYTESVSEDPMVAEPPGSVGDEESHVTSLSDPSQSFKSRGDRVTSHQEDQGGSEPSTEPITPQKKSNVEAESLSEVHTRNETSENTMSDGQEDYLWFIWNALSVISMIHFFVKYFRKPSVKEDESRKCVAGGVPLPDSDALHMFHSRCVQARSRDKRSDGEFLDGFANHMVEAMQVICGKNGGMVMEDCQMLDSHDIIVPLTPSEPYSFHCLPWDREASEPQPDALLSGWIKLVENIQNGCPCNSANADDMVCLLHGQNDDVKKTDICERLCFKKTAFLSKGQVTRWFQGTIKQAWAHISHKYDFELSIRYLDAPGALLIRFRSGKKLKFTLNPVVKFNTNVYFFISPCSPNTLDTCWSLPLTIYENQLLERLSKRLPENSCHIQALDIACFLHRRQVALSGSSALKCSHFKTALMHLLLKSRHSAQWQPDQLSRRLRELLYFMERSLAKKLLHHVLIGNPLTTKMMPLPSEFTQSKPVNLFHPLVVESCIYRNTQRHFQEMLQNAEMLIHDYVDRA